MATTGDDNPYASPAPTLGDDRPPITGDAELLERGPLFRRIQLPTPWDAVIEYNARGLGYDAVRVDGRTVVWRWKWVWFVPRFDFTLTAAGETAPAALTVEVGLSLQITRLTIEINDRTVYDEHG